MASGRGLPRSARQVGSAQFEPADCPSRELDAAVDWLADFLGQTTDSRGVAGDHGGVWQELGAGATRDFYHFGLREAKRRLILSAVRRVAARSKCSAMTRNSVAISINAMLA